MTYLIGVILVLLLVALVLVFRPPKAKPYQDPARQDTMADAPSAEEEQLDLAFEEPSPEQQGETAEAIEEFDLVLDEDGQTTKARTSVEEQTVEAASTVIQDQENEKYDDDIQFIDDREDAGAGKGEVAPALADVPEDYAQNDEVETPEELAERLEYFLGTDEKEAREKELEIKQQEAVTADEAVPKEIQEEEETAEEEADEVAETEPVVVEEPENEQERYSADLQEQENRLRSELNAAIEKRETGKLGLLGNALENICVKQSLIQESFQQQQQLLDRMESVMRDVHRVLPGFQFESVQKSLRAGEYEVVRTLLTEAVDQLDESPELAPRVLYQWGLIEEERGELEAAGHMYATAQAGDEDNPDYLLAAGRMARIAGEADKARLLLEKRVSIGQENGEESIEQARAEHELARVFISLEENDRVEPLLLSARAKIEKLLGGEHPDLGPVLHDQATLFDSSARYEQAEPLYKQALEVVEQSCGRDYPRLGSTLNKLAGLYEEIEMEDKSEPLYTRAMEIKQKVLGESHPDVGTILNHLANLLKLRGKYDEAEPMFRKSLEIAETALGKDHPNLAVVLNNMAELYSDMGNQEQAEHYQERAFSLFGLPGAGSGFVEMEKDTDYTVDDDKDQTVAGN